MEIVTGQRLLRRETTKPALTVGQFYCIYPLLLIFANLVGLLLITTK